VTFTFHDGGNGVGADLFDSVTQTVNVTAVNDAPVNTVPTALQLTDTTTDLAIAGLSVSDNDAAAGSVTTTLQVTNGTLVVASAGGAAVGGSGTNTVTLTGTVGQINITLAALDNIMYHPGAAGSDTLTITTNDGGNSGDDPSTVGQPATGNATSEQDVDSVPILVSAPPVVGAPELDLDGAGGGTGFTTSFTEGGTPVPIADADASITDAVPGTIASATITIDNHQTGDGLSVNGTLPGGIVASSYNPVTGELTLSGVASLTDYAAALRQIEFANSSDNPVAGNRSIAVVVSDGTNNSNIAIATIQVAGTNDAPVVDLDGGGGPVDYATSYVATGAFIPIAAGAATVTDADNATLTSATVVLTNAQTDDVLAISGALPAGITATIDASVANQITVTLLGSASPASYQAALHQVVFANSATTPDPTPRVVTVTVSDGTDSSPVATTTINIAANSSPVANDDNVSATEAGGVNNTIAGSNPSGNVITGAGSIGSVADTDAQDGPAGLTVVAVKTGPEGAPVTTGTVGVALQGTYGTLTLSANGAYSYAVNNTNTDVQALTSGSPPLADVFNYTIQDSGGASDTATLTISINGADDLVQAVADVRTITEDAAPTTVTVLANDTLDPDAGALNTITTGTITATGPGGANIDALDVSVSLIGGTQIEVTLGADFQRLTGSETATITIPYTLTGNGVETSTANLVITVNGVNDLPVAVSDLTGNTMTEDAAATTFAVLGNDTLDKDHGALNTITTGTVTASGPVGTGIDAADVTVDVIGGTQIRVTLQSDFQRLQEGQTATIDVPYTLAGDGADASSATFRVTVNGANDAPVVTAGAGTSYTENAAAVTIAGGLTLTDIDNTTMSGATFTLTNAQAGDVLSVQGQGVSGDLASGVHFVVDNTAHTVTFSNVDTAADYQAALRLVQFSSSSENPSTAARSFTITADDGQTLNHNGSASASLAVVAIDDAPVNTIPADNAVPTAFSNTNTAISGISIVDVDSGSGTITTQLSVAHGTVAVTLAGGATISAGASGSATLTLSGSAAAINATLANNVTYRSADGYVGADDLSVVTNDLGLTGNGGPLADTDTVHIGVVPQVWYIDNSNAGPGNGAGTVADPFHSIAAFNASAGPGVNDYIVLRTGTGTYTGEGLNLKDGQQVYGAGETLQFTNPVTNQVVNIANAGTRPTINVTVNGDQGIDLASGNTIKGVNITTGAGTTGLDDGNNSVGSLTVDHMTISGAGQAVDIDQGGALTVSLESVSASGGAQGIQLAGGLTGAFTVSGNLNITGSTTAGIDINGNTGTYNFNGGSKVVNTGTHDAISLNNAGTVNFAGGGLDIDATTGAGFRADGSSIVSVSGSGNSVTTTTGQVVNWNGVSVGAGNVTFSSLGATGTVANTAISLNNVDGGTFTGGNVTIAGTSGTSSDGIRIEGGSSTNFSFSTITIDNTGGDGIELGGANGTVTFNSVDIDGVARTGLNISGNTNTVTVSGGSIGSTNDPGLNAVDIDAGSGDIAISASVTKNTAGGDVVEITGRTGGTVTFSGAVSASGGAGGIDIDANTGGTINFNGQTTLNTGAINGVDLTNNAGATINFNAGGNGLDITTTTGVGFNATGAGPAATTGGTVTVEGTGNTITSTTGTALNVVNTTIGANGLKFQSISSNGAANGIVLNNTGTSGGLTVTGDGGGAQNHSGGIINASTGAGVSLTSTKNVSLGYLDITNGLDDGIHGEAVNGFTLNRANVNNNGNSTSDDGIQFGRDSGSFSGVTGAVSITNSSVSGNAHNNVHIRDTGTDTISSLTVTGSSFNNLNDTFGANSFLLEMSETSILTSGTFSNNTVQNNSPQRGLEVQTHDTGRIGTSSGTGGLTVSGNTFVDNGIQASFTQDGASNLTFKFLNNGVATPMTGSILQAVNVFSSSQSTGGTIFGTISGNRIGNAAVANSGSTQGGGISALIQGQTDATLLIDGNTVVQTNGDSRGIYVGFRGPANPLAGTLPGNTVVSDLTLTNNTVTPRNTANNFGAAIVVEADNQSFSDAKAPTVRANITGNTVPTTAVHPVTGEFFAANLIYFEYSSAGARGIGQLVDTGAANANATDQLTSTNTGTSRGSAGIDLIPGPIGTPPLNAAAGGVQASSPTPGETRLTQAQLDSVVAAAISQWQAAGASAAQIAALHAVTFGVADLSGTVIGEQSPAHITIDADAGGHGWFVDPTPLDNSEFTQTANAQGTDLFANSASAAAGHLDLLTAVVHEMGHQLGLAHSDNADDVMAAFLVDGERRLPDAADVTQATAAPAQAPLLPIIRGTAGNDRIDAGHGGFVLVGGAGADNFVFANVEAHPSAPPPLTHVADYHFTEGDVFDFSALTAPFHGSGAYDASVVRAVEDASGTFATLQVNTANPNWGTKFGPTWTDVARIDGANAGEDVAVLMDGYSGVHLAHLHVGLLT
jgi:VCBS repeat-containing protein